MKHCRVQEDEGQFTIGSATFDSLSELVAYYEKNPLYRKMKLRYAINDEVLNSLDKMTEDDNIYVTYMNPNDFNKPQRVTVRALYEYNAMRKDELTFCQGAIITNVEKVDGGWWCGDYGNQYKGWFPANYVEEVVLTQEDKQLGNLQQGAINIQGCAVGACLFMCGYTLMSVCLSIVHPCPSVRVHICMHPHLSLCVCMQTCMP